MLVILVLISAVGLKVVGPMPEPLCEAAVHEAIDTPTVAEMGMCISQSDHPMPTFAMKRIDKSA